MDSPGINYPPPLWFVVPGLGAWFLERAAPAPLVSGSAAPIVFTVGCLLVVLASIVLLWSLATFARLQTGIFPNQSASRIVAVGPYRFSRNPMYTALATATAGIGLALNSIWIVLAAAVGIVAVYAFVVRREEAYLTSEFGPEYREYVAKVRRWI